MKLAEGADHRNRLVCLTRAGEERLEAALPAWEAAQQRLIDRLGEDRREQLLQLLDELAGPDLRALYTNKNGYIPASGE